jgi:transaldolase
MDLGVISGATTNPKILSLEEAGYVFKDRIQEIIKLVHGPVSVELTEEEFAPMVKQAQEFSSWDKEHIVIKVPMGLVGLKVASTLEGKYGIKTNVTVVMSFNQAYLAALAGATYVSIFSGRIKDMGYNPTEVISKTREMIDREGLKAKIIVGSIRHFMDVNEALSSGAHIVTVPPDILKKMPCNPQTECTIREFNEIWKKINQEKKIR